MSGRGRRPALRDLRPRLIGDPLFAAPGFYRTRMVSKGPWVPCRLWREEEIDESGEHMQDVVYHAEIDGEEVDPVDPPRWPWEPIDVAEYDYLRAKAKWAREQAPSQPAANPYERPNLDTAELF